MALNIPEFPALIIRLQIVRNTFPTPLGDKHGECLIELIRETHKFSNNSFIPIPNEFKKWFKVAGLLKKNSGTRVALPRIGNNPIVTVSQDSMAFPTSDSEHYDFIKDGEGEAKIIWGAHFNRFGPDKYLDITPWLGSSIPIPVPEPSNDDLKELKNQINALSQDMGTVLNKLAAIQISQNAILNKKHPAYTGKLALSMRFTPEE